MSAAKPLHFFLERYANAYRAELAAFIAAVRGRRPMPVGPEDEHTARSHPKLIRVESDTGWRDLARLPSPTGCGTRCAALTGDGGTRLFRCTIYLDRPTACRDLEPGSPRSALHLPGGDSADRDIPQKPGESCR